MSKAVKRAGRAGHGCGRAAGAPAAAPHRPAAVSRVRVWRAKGAVFSETARPADLLGSGRAACTIRVNKPGATRTEAVQKGKNTAPYCLGFRGVAAGSSPANGAAAPDSPECARSNPPGRRCAPAGKTPYGGLHACSPVHCGSLWAQCHAACEKVCAWLCKARQHACVLCA